MRWCIHWSSRRKRIRIWCIPICCIKSRFINWSINRGIKGRSFIHTQKLELRRWHITHRIEISNSFFRGRFEQPTWTFSSCVVLEVVSEVYDQPMAVEGRGSPIMYVPARQYSSYSDRYSRSIYLDRAPFLQKTTSSLLGNPLPRGSCLPMALR